MAKKSASAAKTKPAFSTSSTTKSRSIRCKDSVALVPLPGAAAATIAQLREQRPDRYEALAHRTGLKPDEVEEWRRAADNMNIPFDERRGISYNFV